jgi:Domain of unknown function (DUF4276)
MKFLYIIVEGKTEETFVNSLLRPYFAEKGFYNVINLRIQTSKGHKGGFVNYQHLKNDITNLLKHPEAIVTTLVDFFRLPTNIPNFETCMKMQNATLQVECLEKSMSKDIASQERFLPYIQKFEFEALLFSKIEVFETIFDNSIKNKIENIRKQYPNPEDINSGANTSPSKRLLSIISNYDKVIDGNSIALETGITEILNACPRFKAWIELLKEKLDINA